MKAVIKEVTNPSYLMPIDNEMPKRSRRKPPIKDPIHPTIMLPSMPYPFLPFITIPASQPATAPIIRNHIIFIKFKPPFL